VLYGEIITAKCEFLKNSWFSIEEFKLAKKNNPVLGILRLDYNYPAAPGDIDHPGSFNYEVCYRVIPGLTFEMCQTGSIDG
jgi:hypothetical protein